MENPNPADQFVYTPSDSKLSVVVTKIADGFYHWQVIHLANGRVESQGEVEGFDAKTNALTYGINALREIKDAHS